MKNIQVIDGAENAVYDVFSVTDEEFSLIFPEGEDVAFIDEVMARGPEADLNEAFEKNMEAAHSQGPSDGNTRSSLL